MKKTGYTVELRFRVPLHLAEEARKAMAPYSVGEIAGPARRRAPAEGQDDCQLTGLEIELLLRG
ncbi:MAG: hypothetical protein ACOZEN_12070 [Thermodesulfobacteriota bacterium]